MKKIIITLLWGGGFASAQIPILTDAFNPLAGDSYQAFGVDTSVVDLDVVGTNQIWTIPALYTTTVVHSDFTVESSATTPYANTFSVSAQVGIKDSYQNSYTFFSGWPIQLELNGYGNVAGVTTFTNSAIVFTYPFTYGETVIDDLAGTATIVYPFSLSGTTTSIADAYGTLSIPSGTYNVLRIKIDQVAVSNNPGGSVTTNRITYYWMGDTYKYPLMEVDISKTLGTGIFNNTNINDTTVRAYLHTPIIAEVRENTNRNNFSFYPNPSNGKVNLSFSIYKPSIVKAYIINTLGQQWSLIDERKTTAGVYNETINIENFAKGIYTIRLVADRAVSEKKIIIQ